MQTWNLPLKPEPHVRTVRMDLEQVTVSLPLPNVATLSKCPLSLFTVTCLIGPLRLGGWFRARAQALTLKALGTTLVAIAMWRQHLQIDGF